MSGKVRVWPDGRIVIETDEPVPPESVEMIARSIRERSLLILGKGWTLEHEGPLDFGIQWKNTPPNPGMSEGLDPRDITSFAIGFMSAMAIVGILAMLVGLT